RRRMAGTEGQRPSDFAPRRSPIPLEKQLDESEGGVGLHERAVQRERTQHRLLGLGVDVMWGNVAEHSPVAVGVTQPRVGKRVRRIVRNRPLKVVLGLSEAGRVALSKEVPTLEVQV